LDFRLKKNKNDIVAAASFMDGATCISANEYGHSKPSPQFVPITRF